MRYFRAMVAPDSAYVLLWGGQGRRRPTRCLGYLARCTKEASSALRVLRAKLFHEGDQRLDALDRHGVVDRRAHAADGAMALQLREPARLGFGEEPGVELVVAQAKGHVHARAVFRRDGVR